MKLKTKLLKSLSAVMNCIALALVVQTANSACIWIFHQPDFPEEAKCFNRMLK